MIKRVISIGLFALTAGTLWSLGRELQRVRDRDGHRVKPQPVQTWEGEGGALPATGAQLGPEPAAVSQEARADAESD
jgi:hypothetical protein